MKKYMNAWKYLKITKIKKKKFWHQATECETGGRCEFKYKKADRVNLRSKIIYMEVGQSVELIQVFYI